MSLLTETIGTILDNYADVIEGGTAYRGSGTAYDGIPGTRSPSKSISAGETTAGGSGTTVQITTITAAVGAELARAEGPPFFLLCTAQASGTSNVGAARKISSHDGTDTFTVATAFPVAVASGDTFSVVEGFLRMPDAFDIESEDTGSTGGWDRVFHLSMLPGTRLSWYGNGTETYESELEVRIRILKRSRARQSTASALENSYTIRSAMSKPTHRGDYTQLIDAEAGKPEVLANDNEKIVILDKLRCVYQTEASFL